MLSSRKQGITLQLAFSPRPEAAGPAVEKWLLGLWQVTRKQRWRLWRDLAPLSLEYLACGNRIRYQVHLRGNSLAEATRRLLPALLPGMDIVEEPTPTVRELFGGGLTTASTFELRHPGWVALGRDRTPPGVFGVLSTLPAADLNSVTLLQLLLQPTWITTEDGRTPAFWLQGRIVVRGPAVALQTVAASLGQFSAFNGFSISRARQLSCRQVSAVVERRWPRRILPAGKPALAEQVALLFQPPTSAAHLPLLQTSSALKTPTAVGPGVVIGEGRDAFGRAAAVRLAPADLLRHALVVGPSGSGKTTFLANLARSLITEGVGVTVIDPHGSLASEVARTLPPSTRARTALLRLSDVEHPVSLNPLWAPGGTDSLVADELVEILQRIWGRQHWGVLMELLLRHAALATMAFGGSIADSARLLEDPAFRERKLAEVHDPATQRFFQQLGAAGGLDRRLLPAVHRLQRLLASPFLRNILSQPANAVDYGRVFAAGESLLFDLSGIGAGNAKLLGSLLLLQVRQGALNRDLASASLRPHIVLVDEASWFLSSTVAELFDQARKFGVGLVLAVQRGGQLAPDDVRNAVLANVGTLAVWRVHDHDEASLFARHLGGDRVSAYDLQHLPRYEAYLQTIGDGERHEPAWFRALAPSADSSLEGELVLLKRGRELYSRPRQVVEEALERRDATTLDDDPEILTIADPDPDDGLPADAA